jgi:hypothetical protein
MVFVVPTAGPGMAPLYGPNMRPDGSASSAARQLCSEADRASAGAGWSHVFGPADDEGWEGCRT